MMAIALAGGSVAACSQAPDPTDVEGTAPAPGEDNASSSSAAFPGARKFSTVDRLVTGDDAPPRFTIPRCNANPDPCCRNPDMPGCPVDAGTQDDADAGAGDDAGSDDAAVEACPSSSP
jgi:hypothetical protein